MRSFTALALVLFLCLTLATPSAVAAEPRLRGHEEGGLLSFLWSHLVSWWSPGSGYMDPLGGSQDSTSITKEGMTIDPLGGQQETDSTTEAGMIIDPLG